MPMHTPKRGTALDHPQEFETLARRAIVEMPMQTVNKYPAALLNERESIIRRGIETARSECDREHPVGMQRSAAPGELIALPLAARLAVPTVAESRECLPLFGMINRRVL